MEWSPVATATIAINENPPVANNDAYSINHGQILSVTYTYSGVLANDSDPDGDSLTASLVSNVQHGTLTFNTNGTFTYTPATGFFGTDTFTYQDTDGMETSTVATVTIAVNENPPVANNDTYSVAHGQVLSVSSTYNGVLYNDTDPESDSLTASLVSNVQHGTLTFNANGTFTYTPAAGFYGTDTFTYKAYDGLEWSGVATVTIAVTENPPVAKNDAYSVNHGQVLTTPRPPASWPMTRTRTATRSPPRSSPTCSTARSPSTRAEHSPTHPPPASRHRYLHLPGYRRDGDQHGRHRHHRRRRKPARRQERRVHDRPRPDPLDHVHHQRRPGATTPTPTATRSPPRWSRTCSTARSRSTRTGRSPTRPPPASRHRHLHLQGHTTACVGAASPPSPSPSPRVPRRQERHLYRRPRPGPHRVNASYRRPGQRLATRTATTLTASSLVSNVPARHADLQRQRDLHLHAHHGLLPAPTPSPTRTRRHAVQHGGHRRDRRHRERTRSPTTTRTPIAHGQILSESTATPAASWPTTPTPMATRSPPRSSPTSQHGTLSFDDERHLHLHARRGLLRHRHLHLQGHRRAWSGATSPPPPSPSPRIRPVANNDAYIHRARPGPVRSPPTSSGVLANDTDPMATRSPPRSYSNVQHGTLSLQHQRHVHLHAPRGFYGTDYLHLPGHRRARASTIATVTIAVTETPPSPRTTAYSVTHGQILSVTATYSAASWPTTPTRTATRSPPPWSPASHRHAQPAATGRSPTRPPPASTAPTPSPTRTATASSSAGSPPSPSRSPRMPPGRQQRHLLRSRTARRSPSHGHPTASWPTTRTPMATRSPPRSSTNVQHGTLTLDRQRARSPTRPRRYSPAPTPSPTRTRTGS